MVMVPPGIGPVGVIAGQLGWARRHQASQREPDGSLVRLEGHAQRHRHAGTRRGGHRRARRGPGGDAEILYTALSDRLVRLARLTGADTVPAEEIVQDAFAQL